MEDPLPRRKTLETIEVWQRLLEERNRILRLLLAAALDLLALGWFLGGVRLAKTI